VGPWSESHDEHASIRIAESRHGLPPVLAFPISSPLLAGDLFAVSNEARAASASDYFMVENGEPMRLMTVHRS
jgi:hypothetical protein